MQQLERNHANTLETAVGVDLLSEIKAGEIRKMTEAMRTDTASATDVMQREGLLPETSLAVPAPSDYFPMRPAEIVAVTLTADGGATIERSDGSKQTFWPDLR